tara:strand:- start:1 stop:315 length:315 start_codon:yes stop_codon:yes gene_type:complete
MQCIIYLATAPKSPALYESEKKALKSARDGGSLMPPKHILNAPTAMMKSMGYGDEYVNDHNTSNGFSRQNYFPDTVLRVQIYEPVKRGFEREIIKRLEYWSNLR